MHCELDEELNNCKCFDNGLCKNKNKCSFQMSELRANTEKHKREEKWFEKYYRK